MDTSRLSEDLGQLVEQAGTELDLGFEWLSAALSAEDDGLLLTMASVPGGADSSYEPELLRCVPADAVAVVSFGGTQAVLDRVESQVDVDELSRKLEELAGISLDAALDALAGGPALCSSERHIPEVTLVLAPPDPDEAWETLDRLAEVGRAHGRRHRRRIEVFGVAVGDVTALYARLDADTLIVTTRPDGISHFTGDGDKLVDTRRSAGPPRRSVWRSARRGLVYVDLDGLVPLVEDAGESVPTEATDVLESLDAVVLEASGDGETTRVSGFLRLDD